MARRHRTPAGRRSLDSLSDFISDLRGIGEGEGGDPSTCGVGLASDQVLGMGGGGGGRSFRGAFHSSLGTGHAVGIGGRALDGFGPGCGALSHRSSTGSLSLVPEGSLLRGPEGAPYARFFDPRRGPFAGFAGPATGGPDEKRYPGAGAGVGMGGATNGGGATRGLLEMLHYGDPRHARQGDPQAHSLLPLAGRFPYAAGASRASGLPAIRLNTRSGAEGSTGVAGLEGSQSQDGAAGDMPARDTGAAASQSFAAADARHRDPLSPSLLGTFSCAEQGSSGPVGTGTGAGMRILGGLRRPTGPGTVRKLVLGKRPFAAYSPLAASGTPGAGTGNSGNSGGASTGGVSAAMRLKGLLSAGRRPAVKGCNPLRPLSNALQRSQEGHRIVSGEHPPAKRMRALPALPLGAPSVRPGVGAAAHTRPGGGTTQGQASLAELMPPPPPRPPKLGALSRRAAGAPQGRRRGLPLRSRQRALGEPSTAGTPPGGPAVSTGSADREALGSDRTDTNRDAEGGVPLATALVQTKAAAEGALRTMGLAGFGFGFGAGEHIPQEPSLWGPWHTAGAELDSVLPGGAQGGVGAGRGGAMGPSEGQSLAEAFGVPRELQGEFLEELVQVAQVRCVEKEIAAAAREFVAQRKQLLDDFCTELLRLHSSERFRMVPSADPPALILPAVGSRPEVTQAVLQYCSHGDNLQSLCLWLCQLDRPNSLAGTCSAAVAVERSQAQLAEDSHPSTTSVALRRAQSEAPLTVLLKLHHEWAAARKSHRERNRVPVPPFLVPIRS